MNIEEYSLSEFLNDVVMFYNDASSSDRQLIHDEIYINNLISYTLVGIRMKDGHHAYIPFFSGFYDDEYIKGHPGDIYNASSLYVDTSFPAYATIPGQYYLCQDLEVLEDEDRHTMNLMWNSIKKWQASQ